MTCKSAQLNASKDVTGTEADCVAIEISQAFQPRGSYADSVGIACLVTYWVMFSLLPGLTGTPSMPVAIIWAVISAAFVYKNTRSHSMSAGISRLIGTLINVSALFGFPRTPAGMAIPITVGTIATIWLDRSGEISVTSITTAVVLIVSTGDPQKAWQQPCCVFWSPSSVSSSPSSANGPPHLCLIKILEKA